MREHDPNKIPCADGGRAHVVPTEAIGEGAHRIACMECRMVFIRDDSWVQGWRPANLQGEVEKLCAAETIVREQLDPDGEVYTAPLESPSVTEAFLQQELERLQRAVLGVAEGDPLP